MGKRTAMAKRDQGSLMCFQKLGPNLRNPREVMICTVLIRKGAQLKTTVECDDYTARRA